MEHNKTVIHKLRLVIQRYPLSKEFKNRKEMSKHLKTVKIKKILRI